MIPAVHSQTPSWQSLQPKPSIVLQGIGASTIPTTGVLPSFRKSSTKHVVCQGLSSACLLVHHREVNVLQLFCWTAVVLCNAKAWHKSEKDREDTVMVNSEVKRKSVFCLEAGQYSHVDLTKGEKQIEEQKNYELQKKKLWNLTWQLFPYPISASDICGILRW